ncbi:MAG: DUF192 domain-containing protein [Pseudomonadota bacterium]
MVRDWSVRAFALAGAAVLVACSPAETGTVSAQSTDSTSSTETEAVHPISGLKIIDVTIERDAGPMTFKTELADTPEAQARGLMFRTELGDDEAMLFPSREPSQRSFWMKNTPLSLDIIFVGTDGRISNIAANTTPYSEDSVASSGLATAVFEIRAGLSEKFGIKPGDALTYTLPE